MAQQSEKQVDLSRLDPEAAIRAVECQAGQEIAAIMCAATAGVRNIACAAGEALTLLRGTRER
jgi:hypothetical protein